jgi:hypothetical protein
VFVCFSTCCCHAAALLCVCGRLAAAASALTEAPSEGEETRLKHLPSDNMFS